jgi:hypothetical protein
MQNAFLSVKRFLVSEDGPTAVEYAVMLAPDHRRVYRRDHHRRQEDER